MIPSTVAPVVGHLWQSTLFAAVAALLTLALRSNQARARYGLWLVASYKFLIPFWWLVSVGRLFEWGATPAIMPPAISVVTNIVAGPVFLTALPTGRVTPDHWPTLLVAIWAVWACGFMVVVAGWAREWWRIRAIVRAASPLALDLPVPVVSTSERLEPGVFGIFRPVLLLPEGIAARLTPAQLRTVIAHELCHVRRRDNLAAAVHMLVESMFWFYPVVWWLGARMVDERERACDEEVLRAGSEARCYAESILKVCELYLESPLTCISGVTGSDLKERIHRIMKGRFGAALSARKKLSLATAGIVALVLPVVVGVLTVPGLRAQAPAAGSLEAMEAAGTKMAFGVASVKQSKSGDRPISNIPMSADNAFTPTGGFFSSTNSPFLTYLRFAHKNQMLDLSGLPSWIRTERYDIDARAQGNPTKDQYRLMMQSLLTDRFKLAVHHETRQSPIYELVLAKDGKIGPHMRRDDGSCSTTAADLQTLASTQATIPQAAPSAAAALNVSTIPCGVLMMVPPSAPGRVRVAGRMVTLALLANLAPNPTSGVDRPVSDRTGLTGTFDLTFEWAPRLNGPGPGGFTPDPDGPTFTEALQDELGLKLEPQTAPVDWLIVDHLEKPSEN